MRFGLTIFLGAALLFSVQPLLAKRLLPWFGGGPAVWSACMLFFQVVLLLGYAWAHALDRRQPARRQAWAQGGLLATALLGLGLQVLLWDAPLLPGQGWMPADSRWPAGRILLLLGLAVGLPALALGAASPLLQAWHRRACPGKPTYRLYALSNAGSLLALVAYPFLLEPALGLRAQAWAWGGLFALFALGVLACGQALPAGPDPSERSDPSDRPAAPLWLWVALPAAASALLLAATHQMCQEVAVVPFLWVLPLGLYLISFILAFEGRQLYRRAWCAPAFAASAAAAAWALCQSYELALVWQVGAYSALVFFGACLCHGELARLKPPPARLTGFYLALSLGGALGGLFVSLLAPAVFDGPWEVHLTFAAVPALALATFWRSPGKGLAHRLRWPLRAAWALGCLALIAALGLQPGESLRDVVWAERNFYGTLRVKRIHPGHPRYHAHDLFHGQILHGYQLQAPELRRVPTAYFSATSGLGLALQHHPARAEGRGLRVGIIGLGVGTIAAWGQPGDVLRFYEIDPQVIALARGQGGWFTFLGDSQARVEVIEGDARVSLERERREGALGRFDVFVLDAFQSDAIPTHLLDLEAFRLYLEHLAPDGLLLLHVTNLSLSLEPVVDRLAQELGLAVSVVRDAGDGWIGLRSHWALLTRDADILADPELAAKASLPESLGRPAPLWTDDQAALFPILRERRAPAPAP
ncbi:MAG TPA: fused MFS/spermidine synthase [Myxococcota bacterium]|nr:fused MFS/spermidine synthase [Myxococcota bacterium]HRY93824.1 fused MFS/spermidine synthase [Myxococcota bacterium]